MTSNRPEGPEGPEGARQAEEDDASARGEPAVADGAPRSGDSSKPARALGSPAPPAGRASASPLVATRPDAAGGDASAEIAVATDFGGAMRAQAALAGVPVDEQTLRETGSGQEDVRFLLQEAGLDIADVPVRGLGRAPTPISLRLRNGSWTVLHSIRDGAALLADPRLPGRLARIPLGRLAGAIDGAGVTVRKSLDRTASDQGVASGPRHWFWSRALSRDMPASRILLASLAANVLATAASFFALQVYDRVIPNRSEETLLVLLIGVCCALGFEAVLRVARSHVLDRAGRNVDVAASSDLLRRLTLLRLTPELPRPSRLAQLMREFSSLREFVTEAAVGAMADIPFAFLFLGVIYWIAGPVALIPAAAMLLMILPPFLFRRRMLRIAEDALGAHTSAGRVFNEISYGLETVKVNRAETFFADQWKEIIRLIAASSARQRRLSAKLTQWAASVQQAALALAVTASVYQVFAGSMTVGGIIAVTLLLGRCLSPMTRFSTILMRWHQVRTSLDGLDAIARAESDAPTRQPKLARSRRPAQLVAEGLTFKYSVEEGPVLDIEGLRIGCGERVAIVGVNGSGKSTLLRCLSGLYAPATGRVTLDGIDLRQIDSRDLRRAVGYLPQDTVLFNGTLRDNLLFRRQDLEDEHLLAALTRAGLGLFVRSHPLGLDMRIADAGSGLSAGQRQSVGLARLIVNDPGTVLLDEPTASLDSRTELTAIRNLAEWLSKRTFVVATHRPAIIDIVDRVLLIDSGRVSLDGPRTAIVEKLAAVNASRSKAVEAAKAAKPGLRSG